ncbi:MAG: ATPase [Cycloclasticus sp.]|nr:ATPase [Cycloclasticus sp.]MBG96819.1 ATPase [Cycloclasticus sp.]HAI96786.1 ATPase [Methylococcaceae bacterium]|tara:strand:- start:1606 stop:3645 length:2040 start_codon:yes stop_codon:yes gene_type:complete
MLEHHLKEIANVDIFKKGRNNALFVGRPFYLDYDKAQILISDAWKNEVKGIPQGTFLLAFYDGEENVQEAVLLRALTPSKLPTDNDVVSSMIEYYKDGSDISGLAGSKDKSKLDDLTRYEFSFSGLECRVLGSFYKIEETVLEDGDQKTKELVEFGADLENFYSANNYSVYKATDEVLHQIVNQRDGDVIAGNENEFKIGHVRYSSSRRFQVKQRNVDVFISPGDFIGKRTALFGMTRTGKSNTVKKIIEATAEISKKAPSTSFIKTTELIEPFTDSGAPEFPVGQIIFDVNGEYANPNLQDKGTAIFELYSSDVTRYSVLDKPGFKVMKVNFYKEIENGFELIKSYFDANRVTGDYVNNFAAVDLSEPEDNSPFGSAMTRYDRVKAAYLCCLHKAGFPLPNSFNIKFKGNKEINDGIDPSKGITPQQATSWFERIWKIYKEDNFFSKYEKDKGHEWADDDLKSLIIFLTGFKQPGEKNSVSGYKKLRVKELHDLHTNVVDKSFEEEIPDLLRKGKIVIVDLSQGSPVVQKLFSERICKAIFNNSMARFVENTPNNFIQFYFEEAHNLFPKKDEKDLTDVYNRLAKEGAKLHLGMVYATQEVSSISSNILKNTQNWFIAHLNNDDEMKELKKYYDFSDFTSSLLKFSSGNDKGFVRMKTYTNPFVVPVQIDRFLANKGM